MASSSKHTGGGKRGARRGPRAGPARPRPPLPRPFEPGRADPPIPTTDDLEEFVAPPIHGKVHPRQDMDDATPTLDDEQRRYRHHPNDAGSVAFGFDPDAADAAADLAGDLGSGFLSGATRGEDIGDLALSLDERGEDELPLIIEEEEIEGPILDEEPAPPPRRPARRHRA